MELPMNPALRAANQKHAKEVALRASAAPPRRAGEDEDSAPTRLLSKPEVLDRVALTFPTNWKLMREEKFPHGRVLGGKTVWLESEIEAWIAALPERKYKPADTVAA
jgi:predicted DNA-binding transcriptional regulator AlpA